MNRTEKVHAYVDQWWGAEEGRDPHVSHGTSRTRANARPSMHAKEEGKEKKQRTHTKKNGMRQKQEALHFFLPFVIFH